jgi:RNA polymerase sigma-32 factor
MPLVYGLVARYRRRGDSADDLVSEGRLGLIEAADRFDLSRGVRFATYASWWVRAFVRRYALRNMRIVGAPSTRVGRRLVASLPTAQRKLAQRLGRDPSREEIAQELGVRPEEVASVMAAFRARDVALDQAFEERWPVAQNWRFDPEQSLAHKEREVNVSRRVQEAMTGLTDRERLIVEQRLLHDDRTTLASLGDVLGVSRERVRQLEKRACDKLRNALSDVA